MTGQILEFDSEWFGMKVGRCDGDPDDADMWARKNEIDFLYCLLPLADVRLFDYGLDFQVVDVRVEMRLDLSSRPVSFPVEKSATASEINHVADLARTAFKGSRFFNDRNLPRERVADMYEHWLRHSDPVWIEGDYGFATLEENSLGLIAVRPISQRLGVGGRLLDTVISAAAGSELKAVTQGGNTAAQRLFQSRGFRTTATGLWLHKHY